MKSAKRAAVLPLAGKRIIITRARPQAGDLAKALAAQGAEVIELPTIEIRPPASWEPMDRAIRELDEFDILLLTSTNGVESLLARLRACGRDTRALDRLEIGAIGPSTAAKLEKAGVHVDFLPRVYQAEGLLEALGGRDVRGKRILIPRAKVARDLVPRVLAERGAEVRVIEAYETAVPQIPRDEVARLFEPRPDMIAFTSSSTALNFARLVGVEAARELLAGVKVASIGPVTSQTACGLGFEVTVEAWHSTIPGLVEAILSHYCPQ